MHIEHVPAHHRFVARLPEGDAILTYRVTADGSTEVYTDSTQDAFSDGKWGFASCDQPEMALDVNC